MKSKLTYWLLALSFIVAGCSTEKNTMINRGYHNMTAHYNGYFNARELIKESLNGYRLTFKEDYAEILPVYLIPQDKDVSTIFKPMNDAVEKTEKVINRHSMPNATKVKGKNEEWCKWIDENWLVMGEAYFYKREYSPAIEKFDYITKAYKYDETKYDALIWLGRSYTELKDYVKAEEYFLKLEEKIKEGEEKKNDKGKKDTKKKSKSKKRKPSKKRKSSSKKKKKEEEEVEPDFPSDLKDELYAAEADLYIRMEKYDKAIENLKLAIKFTKKKRSRARLTFILAQIQEKKMDYGSATVSYSDVLKLNPTFEMEFYATINRALIYQGGDSKSIKAQLMRLLKDEKNKDYYDQIYYALGEIELKENNRDKGIYDFKRSVATSISNDKQKGRSCLKLADLSFADRDFITAKAYYDSAVVFLPQTYPNYIEVKLKSESLTDLVNNLNEYHLQDSLLQLGLLEPNKLERRIDEIIKQQDEEDERKRLEEEEKKANIPLTGSDNPGGWYWYNATAKSQGANEFKKKWGTRKNEDNWRRLNKSQILTDGEFGTDDDSLLSTAPSKRSREEYLKHIPVSDEQREASHNKLRAALYNSAILYKTNFNEDELAKANFKELVKRYQEGPEVCPSYYQLYLYSAGNNDQKGYRDHIFTDCAETEYRYIIEDPNYGKESEQEKSKDEKAFMMVYNDYGQRKYTDAIEKCRTVIKNDKTNAYLPNYYFLEARCHGALQNLEEMDKVLSELVARFPVHEIGKEAAALLDYLRNKKSLDEAKAGKSTYIFEKDAEHYFVLILPNGEGSVNSVKSNISDFNKEYFNGQTLKVSNNFIDLDNQLVTVKSFNGKNEAMVYFTAFKNDTKKVDKLNNKLQYFVISNKNYASFFIEKKIEDYEKFFQDNYLK